MDRQFKVVRKVIGGGVLKLERVQVICLACGQQVQAVATDGRVKGYRAVAKQDVDFLIKTQLERKQSGQTLRIGSSRVLM